MRLDVFNTNDILQGSITPSSSNNSAIQFYGFTSTTPIGRIMIINPTVDPIQNNDVFGVDNIQFTVTAVPEPTSIAGFGVLAAGFAIWIRRRKRLSKCLKTSAHA